MKPFRGPTCIAFAVILFVLSTSVSSAFYGIETSAIIAIIAWSAMLTGSVLVLIDVKNQIAKGVLWLIMGIALLFLAFMIATSFGAHVGSTEVAGSSLWQRVLGVAGAISAIGGTIKIVLEVVKQLRDLFAKPAQAAHSADDGDA